MPHLFHFSTRADYERLIEVDPTFSRLFFVLDGFYDHDKVDALEGLLSLPGLGVIPEGRDEGPMYWVFLERPDVRFRSLSDANGREVFVPDTRSFGMCLQFQPNGLLGERTLVSGSLEVTNAIGDTLRLYRQMDRGFARVYTKSKYYNHVTYAGPDALALRKKRYRLCANPHLTRADDFKLEETK